MYEDQTVTLANERVAIPLDQDEAYKLFLTLQAVFIKWKGVGG